MFLQRNKKSKSKCYERISMNGNNISDKEMLKLIEELEPK